MTDAGPFLRGCPDDGAGAGRWAGSRLRDEYAATLPADTVGAGRVPAGVRLELAGTARALDLDVSPGPALSSAAPTMAGAFSVWGPAGLHGRVGVPGRRAIVRFGLPERAPDEPVVIHVPQCAAVEIAGLRPVGGTAEPAPRGPRWVAYGDSITQGWSVSDPGRAWTAVVARRLGLDVLNLGFAGAARGELPVAAQIAADRADLLTLAWGTNCWTGTPHDPGLLRESVRLFLTTVRQGHPAVPVVVVSPIVRPAAEQQPNRFGATLADLRSALEEAVAAYRDAHNDPRLSLLPGAALVTASDLVDGVHPGDGGHAMIAAAVIEAMRLCGCGNAGL